MCGIAGLWSPRVGEAPRLDELRAMAARLVHRGPDGEGFLTDGPIGLAHRRLSIIDLAAGAQPLANEDETVWVSFNGEIFNYKELRTDLLARGHRFKTESDTEVLVHLYEDHGDAFVEHLNGQFAIALWDRARERLLLARDRVGIRPLFYATLGPRLAFASEVKALFALPEVQRRLDPAGLASVFSFWSVLDPDTVFEGVQSVPPGHTVAVDRDGLRVARYWHWSFDGEADGALTDDDAAEAIHALLSDAVRLQLRADVPVGAYLSGGLDSSIVTTIASQQQHRDGLRSFSLGFDDPTFDESTFQHRLVDHLGSRHSSIRVRPTDVGDAFARMVWHAETPVTRTAPVPMMLLADSVRAAGMKVVLTGEGADEAFGGYDLFKEARVRRRMRRSPCSSAMLRRLYPYLPHAPGAGGALAGGFFARDAEHADAPWFAHGTRMATSRRALAFMTPAWRHAAQTWDAGAALRARLPTGFDRWPALARDQFVEALTLMSGYLLAAQGDRMAMAASVEARYPFLDHRVLEFAARLPSRLKLRGLREKRLLKRAWRHELPPTIVERSKQPYRAPDVASFFGADGRSPAWLDDLLGESSLRDAGLFEPRAVGLLTAKCRAGQAIGFGDNIAFIGIVSTMLLHRQFVRGDGSAVLH